MTSRVGRIEDTLIEMKVMIFRLVIAPQQPTQTVVDNSFVYKSNGVDDPILFHQSEKNSDYKQRSLHPCSLSIVLEDDFELRQNRIHAWRHELDGHRRGQHIDPGRVIPPMVERQQQQPQERILRGQTHYIPRRNQQQQRHRGTQQATPDFDPTDSSEYKFSTSPPRRNHHNHHALRNKRRQNHCNDEGNFNLNRFL
ncbi:hypothetical protein FRX31_023553 [Thalictrum thalictroides]|uniref:Uncharacterized protein n=1 Tax=Thalictrum thalictroides TaxID=46969 RepID=A0A7J6VRP3_THATH|nr:hypothetical protein FRX31_023553 [Thalictrum thalictroides]